jgi:hypothetical protein
LAWPLLRHLLAATLIPTPHPILRASYWKTTLAACVVTLACLPVRLVAQEQNNTRLIIEDLRCQGNRTTSCRFILGYLYLSRGDAVNEDEIQSATLRLSQLRNFEHVDIHLEKGSRRGRVVLVVDVKEATPIDLQSALGVASIGGGASTVLAGRMVDVNVFGEGKILDLLGQTQRPLAGSMQEATSARLEYIDPQFLSASKYFFGISLSYLDSHQSFDNGNRFDAHLFDASVSFGHRFGAFSYVTAGYDYRLVSNVTCSFGQGSNRSEVDKSRGGLLVSYGWISDDPYFPTHGSQMEISAGKSANGCESVSLLFLKTWAVADRGYLSIGVQQTSIGITYAHDLTASIGSLPVRRARWYVTPGVWYLGYSTKSRHDWEAGIRTGVRLDIPGPGIIDLFVFGVTDLHRGARP